MDMRREYCYGSRIRQVVCLIFGICVAALLTGSCVERGIEQVEAKMERTQKSLAKEVLRFHVLANSDSDEDQAVKV